MTEFGAQPKPPRFADIWTDAAGVAGSALVCFGCWEIYRPAGYIAAGLFLLVVSYILSRE